MCSLRFVNVRASSRGHIYYTMEQMYRLLLLMIATLLSGIISFQHGVGGRIKRCTRGGNLSMRWGMKSTGSSNKPTGDIPDGLTLRDTVPFELRGFSLPLVVFSVGTVVTASSFVGFFSNQGGSEGGALSSLGFVYGIPIFLIGLSLWYAEIPPVPVISSEAGDRAWEQQATPTLVKIKQDVTRHRYGDDAHLDTTLQTLGLRLPQKKYPKLLSIAQEVNGSQQLVFTMTFESAETPYKVWAEPDRLLRYEKFFGPDISAAVEKVDPDKRIVAIKLTRTSSSTDATSSGNNASQTLVKEETAEASSQDA